MRYTATVTSGETTTAAELTMTVNQQTSTTDSDLSTVTDDVTRVTDSQTLTGTFYCTVAILCRPAQGEDANTKLCFCWTPYANDFNEYCHLQSQRTNTNLQVNRRIRVC